MLTLVRIRASIINGAWWPIRMLRRLIYHLGFRPRYGSIWYSPSLEFLIPAKKAMKNFSWDQVMVVPTSSMWVEKERQIAPEELTRFKRLVQFCPACGKRLGVGVLASTKGCRYGHGTLYVENSNDGLPLVTFQPAEWI